MAKFPKWMSFNQQVFLSRDDIEISNKGSGPKRNGVNQTCDCVADLCSVNDINSADGISKLEL